MGFLRTDREGQVFAGAIAIVGSAAVPERAGATARTRHGTHDYFRVVFFNAEFEGAGIRGEGRCKVIDAQVIRQAGRQAEKLNAHLVGIGRGHGAVQFGQAAKQAIAAIHCYLRVFHRAVAAGIAQHRNFDVQDTAVGRRGELEPDVPGCSVEEAGRDVGRRHVDNAGRSVDVGELGRAGTIGQGTEVDQTGTVVVSRGLGKSGRNGKQKEEQRSGRFHARVCVYNRPKSIGKSRSIGMFFRRPKFRNWKNIPVLNFRILPNCDGMLAPLAGIVPKRGLGATKAASDRHFFSDAVFRTLDRYAPNSSCSFTRW